MGKTNRAIKGRCFRTRPGSVFAAAFVVFATLLFLAAGSWGAAGDVLWESKLNAGGFDNQASAVTAKGKRVFAAGQTETAEETVFDWLARAYSLR